jgi:superfamily II DNA or RNA helicase
MELYNHQKEFLKENPDKSALVWSCGTGKTRTAIEWAKTSFPTLIICPKALKTNWQREAQKWGLRAYGIMTKEEFRKHGSTLPAASQVIVDEVHNGFLTPHFKSQMSKALRDYIKFHKVPRILLLSATVYTSSPWNIYNLAYYLGYKLAWQTFNYRFFNQVRFGPRIVPVPKKGCEKDLAEITKKIASVVDIADVMDVPLQQHCEPEYFALNNAQRRMIEDAYDPLPIVRFTAEHKIEQLGDKNDRLVSLVEENPKIAIVCRYLDQIDHLKTLLAPYKPYVISGEVKDRDTVVRQADASERAVVLIQADCGIGFELPSFSVCVFASQSYSYTSFEQMCGRFLRMNKPSRTTFVYLLTEGDSIDQAVYNAIKRKEDFQINLYERERFPKYV